MRNTRPPRPRRDCRYSAGPGLSRRTARGIAMESAINSGSNSSPARTTTHRSKGRFQPSLTLPAAAAAASAPGASRASPPIRGLLSIISSAHSIVPLRPKCISRGHERRQPRTRRAAPLPAPPVSVLVTGAATFVGFHIARASRPGRAGAGGGPHGRRPVPGPRRRALGAAAGAGGLRVLPRGPRHVGGVGAGNRGD